MRNTLDLIQRFVRATFFGFTAMLVLLGAGAVDPDPDIWTIVALVVVALNFHIFGYVHNDIVDLSVDRTAPLRAADPLVTGKIQRNHALVFAWMQIPTSFVVTAMAHGGWRAHVVLLLGYVATVVYNVYGKRCRVPVLTDAVQGVAWISLALYGSLLVGEPSSLSLVIAAFGFGFIFLINGVHGGLRDLRNDLQHGRMTTAIFFGARPVDRLRVRSTRALQVFTAVPLTLMLGPLAAALLSGRLEYTASTRGASLSAFAALAVISLWLCWRVVRDEHLDRARRRAVYGSAFFLLLTPLAVFEPMLGAPLGATVAACFFLPLAIFQDRVGQLRALLDGWRTHGGADHEFPTVGAPGGASPRPSTRSRSPQ